MSVDIAVTHVDLARKIARGFAYRSGAMDWADDLHSAALESLANSAASFRPERNDNFRGYALARMRWAVVDEWRKITHAAKYRVHPLTMVPLDDDHRPSGVASHEDAVVSAELMADLETRFADRERHVFRRVYIDGALRQDVATEVGISPSMVSRVLSHIHEYLKGELEDAC